MTLHPKLKELLEEDPGTKGEWSWSGRYLATQVSHDPCTYCTKARAGTWDHLDPRLRDGTHDVRTNLVRSCGTCNRRKADLPLLQFLAYEALYKHHGITGRKRAKKLREKLAA